MTIPAKKAVAKPDEKADVKPDEKSDVKPDEKPDEKPGESADDFKAMDNVTEEDDNVGDEVKADNWGEVKLNDD